MPGVDFLCCDNPEHAYVLARMGEGLGGLKAVCRTRKLQSKREEFVSF